MRVGVCTGMEHLKAAVPGLDFIEPTVDDLLCPRQTDHAFQKRLAIAKACPVPAEAVNILFPGDMKTVGPVVRQAELDAYMGVVLRRAAQVGVKVIVFGAGGSRRVPEGFDHRRAESQLAGHLQRWAPLAATYDLVIALEPLNKTECNIVNTIGEAADVVRMEHHPNIKVVVDTYHMVKDGDKPEGIRRAKGLIGHVHCAESDGRGPLGAKGEDHRPYFHALKETGYDGRVSIEARWERFEQQLSAAVAELRKQWETA